MHTSSRIVWYKQATVEGGKKGGATLQAMLAGALAGLAKKPAQRLFKPDPDAQDSIGINAFFDRGEVLVGQFIGFEAGRMQPTIRLKGAGTAFDINAIRAGADDDAQREFLDGICYFVVWNNHLVFVQSKSLDSRDFERYLNWLLKGSESLSDDEALVISDVVPTATLKNVADRKLRGVTFGTPLFSSAETVVTQDKTTSYVIDNSMIDALTTLLPEMGKAVNVSDALADPAVFVTVNVRVKGSRSVGSEAQKLLQSLAKAARHSHPDDLSLEVSGIGKLKGKDFRIFRRLSVKLLESGGLVDEATLWDQMKAWLLKLMDDKVIPA